MDHRLQLRPTPEQYREFGDYLCEAHSWYKHLPLLSGGQFVVFVAADAGTGRLIATTEGNGFALSTPPDGPEFTDEHPRLHYGWKTTKEYHSRFGYLDYMWRESSDQPYSRDAGPPIRLPEKVEGRCGFVLYPFVSEEFSEAVTWSTHQAAIEQLRSGAEHPDRAAVLELAHFATAVANAWAALGDLERDWVLSSETGDETPTAGKESVELRSYLDLDIRLRAVATALRAQEMEKIRWALVGLDDWLLHGS